MYGIILIDIVIPIQVSVEAGTLIKGKPIGEWNMWETISLSAGVSEIRNSDNKCITSVNLN